MSRAIPSGRSQAENAGSIPVARSPRRAWSTGSGRASWRADGTLATSCHTSAPTLRNAASQCAHRSAGRRPDGVGICGVERVERTESRGRMALCGRAGVRDADGDGPGRPEERPAVRVEGASGGAQPWQRHRRERSSYASRATSAPTGQRCTRTTGPHPRLHTARRGRGAADHADGHTKPGTDSGCLYPRAGAGARLARLVDVCIRFYGSARCRDVRKGPVPSP